MNLINHLDKNNLHHAYLIEGAKEEIVPEIFKFLKSLGIETSANPDFYHINFDSFKIEDARNLKSMQSEKSFSADSSAQAGKKIFLVSANNFLLEAQNTLLKIFEEPIKNTHFFIIVPNKNTLLKTLVSRFYLISTKQDLEEELKEVKEFIKMPLRNRLDFIKELLTESESESETSSTDSVRVKALKFLNALEVVVSKTVIDTQNFFSHLFKVREFANQPGSSLKTLMESVALIVPSI